MKSTFIQCINLSYNNNQKKPKQDKKNIVTKVELITRIEHPTPVLD